MSKINTYEDAIKLLQSLKAEAETVDMYEDDVIDDYRQMAKYSQREMVDMLMNLEIADELLPVVEEPQKSVEVAVDVGQQEDVEPEIFNDKTPICWSIEVYSIRNSKDLFVLELNKDPQEDEGGYFGYKLSYDLLKEKIKDAPEGYVVTDEEVTLEESIDDAIVGSFYFTSNKTTGKVYLEDVIAESEVDIDSYLCGYDSSYFYDAVISGLYNIEHMQSIDNIVDNATQRSKEEKVDNGKSDVEYEKD